MHFGSSSRSIRFRNECAAVSAPCLVHHLTCTFPKKFCRSERALLPAHLDAIRLRVLPMAIGLNPPSIFMRAISFAPKKKGPMRFISLVSDFRKISPALPFDAFEFWVSSLFFYIHIFTFFSVKFLRFCIKINWFLTNRRS